MDAMKIKEEHKALLKNLGLSEEDFKKFDGKHVTYEYDEQKGVRIYDPYYVTSYNEYVDVDGWSSWSCENDSFMSNILTDAKKEMYHREAISPKPSDEEIAEALKKKFVRENQDDTK